MNTRTLIATAAAALTATSAAAQAPTPTLTAAPATPAERWTVDPFHSSVGFAVRHMGLSTVRGTFQKFSATIDMGRDLAPVRVEATIDPASIATGVERRDNHLRSPDFFDVARYPQMSFASTRITPVAPNRYRVEGNLTMRGESRPVTLTLETTGNVVVDMDGKARTSGILSGTLNRKDWGLTWNRALELGGVLVGEDVTLAIEVQAVAPTPVAGSGAAAGTH